MAFNWVYDRMKSMISMDDTRKRSSSDGLSSEDTSNWTFDHTTNLHQNKRMRKMIEQNENVVFTKEQSIFNRKDGKFMIDGEVPSFNFNNSTLDQKTSTFIDSPRRFNVVGRRQIPSSELKERVKQSDSSLSFENGHFKIDEKKKISKPSFNEFWENKNMIRKFAHKPINLPKPKNISSETKIVFNEILVDDGKLIDDEIIIEKPIRKKRPLDDDSEHKTFKNSGCQTINESTTTESSIRRSPNKKKLKKNKMFDWIDNKTRENLLRLKKLNEKNLDIFWKKMEEKKSTEEKDLPKSDDLVKFNQISENSLKKKNNDEVDNKVKKANEIEKEKKTNSTSLPSLSELFGKKDGWECSSCLIFNKESATSCASCETKRETKSPVKDLKRKGKNDEEFIDIIHLEEPKVNEKPKKVNDSSKIQFGNVSKSPSVNFTKLFETSSNKSLNDMKENNSMNEFDDSGNDNLGSLKKRVSFNLNANTVKIISDEKTQKSKLTIVSNGRDDNSQKLYGNSTTSSSSLFLFTPSNSINATSEQTLSNTSNNFQLKTSENEEKKGLFTFKMNNTPIDQIPLTKTTTESQPMKISLFGDLLKRNDTSKDSKEQQKTIDNPKSVVDTVFRNTGLTQPPPLFGELFKSQNSTTTPSNGGNTIFKFSGGDNSKKLFNFTGDSNSATTINGGTSSLFSSISSTGQSSLFPPTQSSNQSTIFPSIKSSNTTMLFAPTISSSSSSLGQLPKFGQSTPSDKSTLFSSVLSGGPSSLFSSTFTTTSSLMFPPTATTSQPSLFSSISISTKSSIFPSSTITQASLFPSASTTAHSLFPPTKSSGQSSLFGQSTSSGQSLFNFKFQTDSETSKTSSFSLFSKSSTETSNSTNTTNTIFSGFSSAGGFSSPFAANTPNLDQNPNNSPFPSIANAANFSTPQMGNVQSNMFNPRSTKRRNRKF
ncbi:hypothetical protein SNEBB_001183 [Seison nebaliae]|nr:hypothetical protein SNEBB_001183 [Seison nebaliae]